MQDNGTVIISVHRYHAGGFVARMTRVRALSELRLQKLTLYALMHRARLETERALVFDKGK